jgi:hypothetical protein
MKVLFIATLCLVGCSSSGDRCVPGASVACACAGGLVGAQVCTAEGTFDRCSCDTQGRGEAGVPTDDEPAAGDGGGIPRGPDAARTGNGKLDLLFLIDNSPSMEPAQTSVRRNISALINALRAGPAGGQLDLNIGVVSSDLGAGRGVGTGACSRVGGDRGIFQTKPTCLQGGAKFLSTSSTGARNNFSGTLEAAFDCMADLGGRGCGYEHQLQATRVALYESLTPENAGFLRSDAVLGIVLLSDEDDCSADLNSDLFTDDAAFPGTVASFRCAQAGHLCDGRVPPLSDFMSPLQACTSNEAGRLIKVQEVVESIKALKPRPDQQIVVAGIFGWPTQGEINAPPYRYVRQREGLDLAPICESNQIGTAMPGLRLKKFVDSFAGGSVFSVCQEDMSIPLKAIGEKLAARL